MNSSNPPQPNGQKRDAPLPGAGPLRPYVKPRVNPLVARKRQGPKPIASRPPTRPTSTVGQNRAGPTWQAADPVSFEDDEILKSIEKARMAQGGWSEPPPVKDFNEFPLFTTKRALREGIRYHIMRFNRAKEDAAVDPTDQAQFPRPASLHRRDPRAPPTGRVVAKEEQPPANPVDDAEAERLRQLKAEKEAQRAIDMAQIAPVMKTNEPKPTKQSKKEKALSTYYPKHTDEAKKAVGLRYEETLPWHLEDADGKNIWVGSYVAALSETNVAFVISGGGFRLLPLERYYKFNQKPAFHMFSLEEAEKIMGKNASDVGRWVMKDRERNEAAKELRDTRSFLGGGARVKVESATSRSLPKTERQDDRDLDVSGDEFQDDDEAPGFEADDEDARDAKDRMRRDHLGANLFGQAQEDEVEKEEEQERLEKTREKILGKRTRKALAKLEHATAYASDSDSENPFAESSESESDSAEKDKEGSEKKEEEGKKQADPKDKPTSGTNSKGNTTPSGKPTKPADVAKKGKTLKRPASPNASESSGNESSRKVKKAKKNLATSSLNASRSTTPMPGRPKVPGGAASDGEATAGEGSDGGMKQRKIKLKTGTGAKGTPVGSRAGSPVPTGNQSQGLSPTKAGQVAATSTPRGSIGGDPVQAWEIIEAIKSNPNGIGVTQLMARFKDRVGEGPGQMSRGAWIALVKQNAIYGKDKLLRAKPE